MTFLIIGVLLFAAGLSMRAKFKRKEHEYGVEGMNAILIAAAVLIIFYGIISQMMIQ